MKGLVAAVAACTALKAAAFCAQPPALVCSEYFASDKVFVGRVTEKIPFPDTRRLPPSDGILDVEGHVVRLEVLQTLKGPVGSHEWFYDSNDSGRSDLDVGDTRVIFMSSQSVGGCGPQYRDPQTPLILDEIRALPSRPSSVRLHVIPYFAGATRSERAFLPRSVEIWGTDGVVRTVTPEVGGYAEIELPPGAYRFTTPGIYYGPDEWDIDNVFELHAGECARYDLDAWSAPWRARPGDMFIATDTIKWLLGRQ